MIHWMSIDPGRHCGLVAWQDNCPIAWKLISAPQKMASVEWLPYVVAAARAFGEKHQVSEVAIERPFMDRGKPAPELNTLVRALGTMARRQGWPHFVYNASQVQASVRPRGTQRMATRASMRLGVHMLYDDLVPDLSELSHDVIAAFAVGHCHLCQRAWTLLLERER